MSNIQVSPELLKQFKRRIGDYNDDVLMEDYYNNYQ